MHWAAGQGDGAAVRLLHARGADLVTRTERSAWHPLHVGARGGREEAVRAVLSLGAEVDARDAEGATPLHHAAPTMCSGHAATRCHRVPRAVTAGRAPRAAQRRGAPARSRARRPRGRCCGNVAAMSIHAKLIRRAQRDTSLPPLTWSASLTRALRPTSAVVIEWRSPVGHVVLVEAEPGRCLERARALFSRVLVTETAEDATDRAAWCARPEHRPRAMIVEASRIVQIEALDPFAPEVSSLRAPTGEAISADGWLRVEAGALPVPPGSYLATWLARQTTPPGLLSRDALIAAVIHELDVDEAAEHAEDPELLRELLTERFAEQEAAAGDHLRATSLRRGLTDIGSGAHQP